MSPRHPTASGPFSVSASVRWREFRQTTLPIITFCAVAGVLAVLWRREAGVVAMPGVAEGARTVVSSPQAGRILQLLVTPYQEVEAGQPVAVVEPADPRVALQQAQLALQLERLKDRPADVVGAALDYERTRIELLRTRSELALARVNLARAEADLRRHTPLFQEKLLSEEAHDLSLRTCELYQAEVDEKAGLVAEVQARLEVLRPLASPELIQASDQWTQLEQAARAAENHQGPQTLRAPIRGIVAAILRHGGENVVEGESILSIQSSHSDRVVGYLRQPYPAEPHVGQSVVIRSRTHGASRLMGVVTHIAPQVEYITNAAAILRPGALVDAGLPIVVSLPPQARLRPGELVDLLLVKRSIPLAGPPGLP